MTAEHQNRKCQIDRYDVVSRISSKYKECNVKKIILDKSNQTFSTNTEVVCVLELRSNFHNFLYFTGQICNGRQKDMGISINSGSKAIQIDVLFFDFLKFIF